MSSAIRLVPADQLGTLPPTEYISGTHFIARGLNIVFGASGAFKSFYVLDAALSIAQTSPVVYIAAEGSSGLHRRVTAWCEHYDQTPGQLFFICREVNLLSASAIKSLIAMLVPVKPSAVVVDTYARCIPGGKENDAGDTGIAVTNTAMMQRELNCAAIWVHHANRAERGERGSGAMRGAADAMIELTANGDSFIRVICSKLKDDEPWLTEELRFFKVAKSGILLPADFTDTHHISAQEIQILELLSLEVFETSGAKAIQIGNALNISERHIYRMLSHLKHELTLTHDSKGDPYRLTEKGRLLICKNTAKINNVISLVKPITSEASDTSDIEVTL